MSTTLRKPASPAKPDSPMYKSRVGRLAATLAARDITHFLVTNPTDVGYLTGFLGGDSYLLVGASKPIVLSDFRYQEELEALRGFCEIVIRPRSMAEAVGDMVGELAASEGGGKLGIQAEYMTVAERDAIAKRLGKGVIASTTGVVMALRRVKDAHEISLIARAVKIQEQALLAVLPTIKPGQTELAIAGRLESEMKSHGATGLAFPTIVAARAMGSFPHYRSGTVKTGAGHALLIDWGASFQGYRGDMTRTFAIGKWPRKLAEIHAIVLDAHTKAAEALAPGKKTSDIDKIAREHIKAAGFAEQFGHGLGHGIGMDTHEEPRLDFRFVGTPLAPGNVVTIEPGIYLPGIGGVRIEDDYAITESGAKCLCSLPKTLEWSTL